MIIPLWTASVAKRGVIKTLRCMSAWVLGTILVILVGWHVTGKYFVWKANRAAERALIAAGRLAVAEKNERDAKNAMASQELAAAVDAAMRQIDINVNMPAETQARAIEREALEKPDTAAGNPDPVVMQQLEAAADRAGAAARRLQRAGAGGADPKSTGVN